MSKVIMSREEIKELSQLYDLIQSELEQCPTLTYAEIIKNYPKAKVEQCLRYAPLFGAEDSVNHLFVVVQNKLYVAQEYANLKIHAEIQREFIELGNQEEVFPWD